MEKLFRNKRIIFWLVAAVIFILLVFYAIFAIGFLVQKVNEVFNPSLLKKTEIVKFNLAKVGELRR